MRFSVFVDGVEVFADKDGVPDLVKLAKGATAPVVAPKNGHDKDADWQSFLELLSPGRRQLLRAIKERRKSTLEELRDALGVEKNLTVSGYLTGIKRNASKVGLPLAQILDEFTDRADGRCRYQPGSMLEANDI